MVRLTRKEYEALIAGRRSAQQPAAPARRPAKRAAVHPGLPGIPPTPAVEPLLVGLSGVGRVYTILMPYSEQMLTSNLDRHYMAEARIKKQLRTDATQMLSVHRLPRLQRAAIYYVLHPRKLKRARDQGNWAPTAKAYIDGLVTPNPHRPTEHHLLPDDDHEHLLGPTPVMGDPVPSGHARMSLVIVELLDTQNSKSAAP
ncbi:hypothetical protein [Streptomyces sp. NBC_00470]|uniref:hypothetical protein n=1 Tax=Streptomyces sp. NBC_00470 TaxID=2975753 RepID=UPI002F915B09